MTGKHRKMGRTSKKVVAIGAATATATALTVGTAPPPKASAAKVVDENVDLMAAVNPWPSPGQIPDLTGGLGTLGYDFSQAIAELVIRGLVENFNLAALAQAAGLDPESLLEGLLGDPDFLLNSVLGPVLGEIPIDLGPVLDGLVGELLTDTVLIPVLQLLGIANAQGVTDLLSLLNLVGLDLSDPLNLGNLDVPGLNVITAGPLFTALKLLGVDLGWVPSLPNAVAKEINETDYLEIGAVGLLNTLLGRLNATLPANPLIPLLQGVISGLPIDVPDVVHVRVPVTVGVGLGAFALATAYEKILADLPNQPGGANYAGVNPLLGSVTVLPLLLLFNPARPNGGAFSRFYPLAELFGINTLNPETHVSSSGGIPILNTGLSLGGANLIPVLVDAGVQYHPSSDLAAWPNPFSLANNLMAMALPTYMLRGLTTETITEQLTTQLGEILDNPLGEPLAINLYLTLPSATQPVLEPLYLISDVISLMTFGAAATNPIGMFANAVAPAFEALNNLGYTDVVRNPDGTYTRTLTEAGVPTPFLSFPSGINPLQVPFDIVNLLVQGFTKEFFSGNPTPATPNAISTLFNLLTGGGLGPLGALNDVIESVLGGLNPLATQQVSPLAATEVPAANARMIPVSTEAETDESLSSTAESEPADTQAEEGVVEEEVVEEDVAEEEVVEEDVTEEDTTEKDATEEDATEEDATEEDATEEDATDEAEEASNTPKHAKPDSEEDESAGEPAKQTTPKHAKPDNGTVGDDAKNESASDADNGASDKAA
ncbi:ATPase [Mycobacterium sp.]|uniref:ATPase n=1 Tax=Mycobacterium sp. TaxID=1785 RepID=UPI002D84A639|nr:ATPase [Mycobacterium sp.]